MASLFQRLIPHLKPGPHLFIVANDSIDLCPDIFCRSGLRLVDTFRRPVPTRTEKETHTCFESIVQAEPE